MVFDPLHEKIPFEPLQRLWRRKQWEVRRVIVNEGEKNDRFSFGFQLLSLFESNNFSKAETSKKVGTPGLNNTDYIDIVCGNRFHVTMPVFLAAVLGHLQSIER